MTRDAAANLDADGVRAVVGDLTNLPMTVGNRHADWDHAGGNNCFDEIVTHHAEARDLPLGVANKRLRRTLAPEQSRASLPEGFNIETFSNPPSAVVLLLSGGERFDLGVLAGPPPELKAVHPSHDAASILLALLPLTRDGLEAAGGGRGPERLADRFARHEFGGFSILADMDDFETEGR
jgi:glyoxylase-like metal-dependent hydrolase (beta-lactamase superfamily II)